MNTHHRSQPETGLSRRQFLATTSKAAAGTALVAAVARPGYAAEQNTLKIALIGCGGRGTGAANQALATQGGPVKLWAAADFFRGKVEGSLNVLRQQRPDQVEVPPDRQFVGLDGYKQAMDTLDKGSVVILATPPAFRPGHVEYALSKGLHVFMEKSFAVDAPGIRRILKCGEEAKRQNLKIAGGLMSRHSEPLVQAIDQIHQGAIGDIVTGWAYRVHGTVKTTTRNPEWNELAHQVANYSCFTWLNGSFLVDWLIHNIDVTCWLKNAWPVSVQGMGGRQVRHEADQLFDHYMAEYTFADGSRFVAQGRHVENCWGFFGVQGQGTKGSAVLGEGIPNPRLFKAWNQTSENLIWSFKGTKNDPYQTEHDLLFAAIRNDTPYNEAERCAKSNFTAIMGRMACESGKLVTWDEAMESKIELAPGLESWTMDSNPPAMPDAKGNYPVARPGEIVTV